MTQVSMVFDTLQYAKRLQKAGFTEVQAETQVEIIKEQTDAINELIDNNLATKADIKHLEERINDRMISLEERISSHIVKMTYKVVISLGSMIAVGVALLGILVKLH